MLEHWRTIDSVVAHKSPPLLSLVTRQNVQWLDGMRWRVADQRQLLLPEKVVDADQPVLMSTNIETSILAERFFAGESTASLAKDFGIPKTDVEEAIRFESLPHAA